MKVVIAAAKRSPIGRFLGAFSSLSAPELCAQVISGAVPSRLRKEIDEVILGNVLQAGVGQNPARQAALFADLPETVNCNTINKTCGSGMKSVMLAMESILTGENELVLAGGMESMSNAPHLFRQGRKIKKLGNIRKEELLQYNEDFILEDSMVNDGLWCAFNRCHMGDLAEKVKKKLKISREEQDRFALASHQKAIASREVFQKEIVPIKVNGKAVAIDETPRQDTNLKKLSELKPVFLEKGSITAGNASPLSDGAAVLLIASEKKARQLKLKPLAIIEDHAQVATDPAWYTLAPVQAVQLWEKKMKIKVKNYDAIELNEAFALQSLGVMKELRLDPEKVNMFGGAIALGHPIGCSGARILVTLLNVLEQKKKRTGLATLCIGGGEALAMSVRRVV